MRAFDTALSQSILLGTIRTHIVRVFLITLPFDFLAIRLIFRLPELVSDRSPKSEPASVAMVRNRPSLIVYHIDLVRKLVHIVLEGGALVRRRSRVRSILQ